MRFFLSAFSSLVRSLTDLSEEALGAMSGAEAGKGFEEGKADSAQALGIEPLIQWLNKMLMLSTNGGHSILTLMQTKLHLSGQQHQE